MKALPAQRLWTRHKGELLRCERKITSSEGLELHFAEGIVDELTIPRGRGLEILTTVLGNDRRSGPLPARAR